MSLTSPLFMFICLPIMLAIYAFVPRAAKRHAIAAFSVVFYIVANIENPTALVLLVLTVIAVYFVTQVVDRLAGHKRTAVTAAAVFIFASTFVSLLIFSRFFGMQYPFGASVWLLCAISCIVDVKRGDAPPPKVVDAVFYITYFPVMVAGPIIKYKDSIGLFADSDFSFANIAKGAEYFMLGFVKRFAIAAVLFEMLGIMQANLSAGIGLLSVLEYIFILPVLAYSFFSGYSDMAVGITYMLGFPIKRDFLGIFALSPIRYAKGFMASLFDFFEDYLSKLWRKTKHEGLRGFLTSFSVIFCVMLWFDSEPLTLGVLVFVAALLALFVSSKEKEPKNVILRGLCTVLTLVLTALFWGFIIASDATEAFSFAVEFVKNFGGVKSLLVFGGVSLAKYIITIATALPVFYVIDRAISEEKIGNVRIAVNLVLLLIFIFTLFFWFPQFPNASGIF